MLEGTEISGRELIRFNKNADMAFLSNDNDPLTLADAPLQEQDGILYLGRLKLKTMRSTTPTIKNLTTSKPNPEKDASRCRYL